jgi:hypothetical protein
MLNTGPGAYTLGTVSISRLGSVGLKLMPKPCPSLYVSAVLIWLPGGDDRAMTQPDRGYSAVPGNEREVGCDGRSITPLVAHTGLHIPNIRVCRSMRLWRTTHALLHSADNSPTEKHRGCPKCGGFDVSAGEEWPPRNRVTDHQHSHIELLQLRLWRCVPSSYEEKTEAPWSFTGSRLQCSAACESAATGS